MFYWIIFTSILLEGFTVTHGQNLNRRNWSFMTKRPEENKTDRPSPITSAPTTTQVAPHTTTNKGLNRQPIIARTGLNRRSWASLKSKTNNNNQLPVNSRAGVTDTQRGNAGTQRLIDTRNEIVVEPWDSIRPTARTSFQTKSGSNNREPNTLLHERTVVPTVHTVGTPGQNGSRSRNASQPVRNVGHYPDPMLTEESMFVTKPVVTISPTSASNTGIINDFNRFSHVTALYAFDASGHGTGSSQTPVQGKERFRVLPDGSIVSDFGIPPMTQPQENVTVTPANINSRSTIQPKTPETIENNTTLSKAIPNGLADTIAGDTLQGSPKAGRAARPADFGQIEDIINQFHQAADGSIIINRSLIDDQNGIWDSNAVTLATTSQAPTTTTTSTTPTPIRKQHDNWLEGGALGVDIEYRNDNHVCPTSRARWQDYTVYLEVKPRLCLIKITWNARYKQEPIYHTSWWGGSEVEWTYKTVYDPEIKFVDLHEHRGYRG